MVKSDGWGIVLKDEGSVAKIDLANVESSERTGIMVKDGAQLIFKKGIVRNNKKGVS